MIYLKPDLLNDTKRCVIEPTESRNSLKNYQVPPKVRRWLCVDLPRMEYSETWALQSKVVTARSDRMIETDIVLFLEHLPVFTLGRRGGMNNLTVSRDFLKRAGVPVMQVERGGDITYHGPGQLVIYPIVDLIEARMKVLDYVAHLEEVMIRAAADWGIRAGRNPLNRGIWVDNNKLGSLGIAIRRGISFHGLALNVDIDLEPFQWINPCGLAGIGMTSMARELSQSISTEQVREATRRHMETIFGVELVTVSLSELLGLLRNPAQINNSRW